MTQRVQIRVLGHLEASVDDQPVALGGAKQRAVLAMLGLEANRAVTADRLIEGLWGEEPPASAAKMVQNYVWRLRKALAADGGAEIVTRGRGYELRVDRRGRRLPARAARGRGRTRGGGGRAGAAAREALALFRGEPLADLADEPFAGRRDPPPRGAAADGAPSWRSTPTWPPGATSEIARPRSKRCWPSTRCASGCTRSGCSRCIAAVARPRRSRPTGRRARTLVEEIGVEPAPELRRLHEAILRQDPSLDVEPAAGRTPRRAGHGGHWFR